MRIGKLVKKINNDIPINIYRNGEFLAQIYGEYPMLFAPIQHISFDEKVEKISAGKLSNGKPVIAVYLEDYLEGEG